MRASDVWKTFMPHTVYNVVGLIKYLLGIDAFNWLHDKIYNSKPLS